MKKHNKVYRSSFSLLLAAAVLLTGCGRTETEAGDAGTSESQTPALVIDWGSFQLADPQRTEDGPQWYLTEYHDDWLTPDLPGYSEYDCISARTIDGMLYDLFPCQSGSAQDNDLRLIGYMDSYDVQTGQSSHVQLDLGAYGLQEGALLRSMDMIDDQQAVFLLRSYGDEEMPVPYASLLFYHMEEGVQRDLDLLPLLSSLGIENELSAKDFMLRQAGIQCDRDGCLYLLWNEDLLVLDETGELLCRLQGTGDRPPSCLCKTPEGLPLFVLSDTTAKTNTYWIYDHETRGFRSLGESKYFALNSGCMDRSGNLYYFSDTSHIVRWDLSSGKREKIFDCSANMLTTNSTSAKSMMIRENGDLVFMEPLDTDKNIFVLSPAAPAESRTLTLVSATRGTSIIPSAATLFSTRNPGVTIEISSFETSGSDDLEAYTANLVNRIVAGDAPDMFVVSADTMRTLCEKGALAELTDLIAEDTREQVFDCIWNAGTIDGRLMGLTTDQITYSLLISDELWSQDTWSLEDALELADRIPGDTLQGLIPRTKYDPEPLYWFALYDIESSLVDRENGVCHFDSEVFRRLLEYCKNNQIMEQAPEQKNDAARAVTEGEYLAFAYDNYFGFSDFCATTSLFPENYHWVGVPTDGGSGNLLYARDFLVVSKDTDDLDLIAEFLPILYGEELTRLYPERCLRRDVLRERVSDAREDDPHPFAQFYMGDGTYRLLECKPDGTSYVEDYIAFMDSCILMPPEDSAIASIVMEEVGPYLAGDKDLDAVINIIQSRVQLYLNENQ